VQQLAAALDALGEDSDLVEQTPESVDPSFEPMSTSGLSAADLAAVTRRWSISRDGGT
jgi:mycobactin peptide synthetase MbtE